MKFGTKIDHRHAYKFSTEFLYTPINTKMKTMQNSEVMSNVFNT